MIHKREKIKLTANILFSGIGCQERGFVNSNLFDVKVLNTSEINKESVLSYAAIHCGLTDEMVQNYPNYPSREIMVQNLTDINLGYIPEKGKKYNWFTHLKKQDWTLEKYWLACMLSHNNGDISKIRELPYADFWTCSFPCQNISVSGKMKGFKPDSGTRSSLLWENIRLLKVAKDNNTLPKFIMFENVKNLVSKKFIDDFNALLDIMSDLGFNSYWKVLNAKNCGVPQSRERVFCICIRKDIDNGKFKFPIPFDTGIRLKDILEKNVEEKYYLKNVKYWFMNHSLECEEKGLGHRFKPHNPSNADIAFAVTTKSGGRIDDNYISDVDLNDQPTFDFTENNLRQVAQIYGTEKEPNPQAGRIYDKNYISLTLDTCSGGNRMPKFLENNRFRKLTPRECFVLMGLTPEDCDNAKKMGIADGHLYKQAGNGIVTNCCELIAEHLYKALYDESFECTDENFTQSPM